MKWSIFVIVVLLASSVPLPAIGHDANHPELDSWYRSLASRKGPCCDGSDAVRVDNPDWDSDSGHYRVRLEGEWVDVPADAVIEQPNRAGYAIVWPYRESGKLNKIRCFMPGSMT